MFSLPVVFSLIVHINFPKCLSILPFHLTMATYSDWQSTIIILIIITSCFLSFFQLKGLTRSLWGQISWWRSSLFLNILLSSRAQMRVNPLSDQPESWMVPDGVKLISFFCTVCPNKVLQSEPVDFARLLWASALVFLHRFLRLPADWVERGLVHVWLYMAVYTCTQCSCKQQSRERGEKSSRRGDHNRVGVTFICTQNGVCVGPGPPSLILYQLTPSPHPQTHTNIAEETDSHPRHFFLCFLLLFFPLLLPLLWRFIAFLGLSIS